MKINVAKLYSKFPQRSKRSHKGDFGGCLVFAGSNETPGAGVLSARAASRVGSGYVYLKIQSHLFPLLINPDFIFVNPKSKEQPKHVTSVVVGPGLGRTKKNLAQLKSLLKQKDTPIVIDADAIFLVTKYKLKKYLDLRSSGNYVFTPHEGEVAWMINKSSQWVSNNREKAAILAQKKWGGVVLLKGRHTLISNGTNTYAIKAGNHSLAKAGSGDVLSGILGGLLAQNFATKTLHKKLTFLEVVLLAASIHGNIADAWVKNGNSPASLTPIDLIEMLPKYLASL